MARASLSKVLLTAGLSVCLVLPASSRRPTPVAERMPSASTSLEWALAAARKEVETVRAEIAVASLEPSVEAVFLDECDRLDAESFSSRVELDRVVRADDAEHFARLSRTFDPLHARIQRLRDDVLIARTADERADR